MDEHSDLRPIPVQCGKRCSLINNKGLIIGDGDYKVFLYSNGKMTDMGTIEGSSARAGGR